MKTIKATAAKLGIILWKLLWPLKIAGKAIAVVTPDFIKNSFKELKNVTWPDKRETYRLTVAVFIFAVFFGSFAGVIDWGLDKIFKEIIIGG